MKSPLTPASAAPLAVVLPLAVLLLALLEVLVPPGAGLALHHALGALCHQLADRSFELLGQPMALCHRCTGLYLGLALGATWAGRAPRRRVAALAALPLVLDWGLGAFDLWAGLAASRFGTGLLFGIVLGGSVAAAWRRNPADAPPNKALSSR